MQYFFFYKCFSCNFYPRVRIRNWIQIHTEADTDPESESVIQSTLNHISELNIINFTRKTELSHTEGRLSSSR